MCSTIFWQIIILQAFEKIKRVQLQRFHSVDDPEKKASIETNPLKIFHAAVNNSTPVLQLTPIKRGGVTYQVGYFWNGIGSDCKSGRLSLHNVATDAKRLFESKYNYSCSTVKSTSMSLSISDEFQSENVLLITCQCCCSPVYEIASFSTATRNIGSMFHCLINCH